MTKTTDELIEEINTLYEAEAMDDFDVINSLGIHENNHSKLLRELLNFKKDILDSFTKDVLNIDIVFSEDVEIKALEYYIDILIKDKTNAIIIENKICWAKDQDNQLINYVNTVKQMGIQYNNIYAVYLTNDGTNKIDYEEDLVDLIGIKRFIQINYKNDLLMWFKQINKNMTLNLDDYISYLCNYLIGDEDKQPIEYKAFENILKTLQKENKLKECLTICSLEGNTKNDDENKKAYSFVRWMVNNQLYQNLSVLFPPPFYNDVKKFRTHGNDWYILFFKEEWRTEWYIHFEWILDVRKIELRLELHFEQRGKNTNVGKTAKYLEQNLKGLITGSGGKKVYYTKRITLNNDLSIDENAVKDDIKKITESIDEYLINKL